MESKKLIFDEAEVNITIKGVVKNKAIVFIHGNSLSSSSFKNQLETLNYPVVAIDIPGHGGSSPAKDPETYSIPGYAKAVKHILDELQLEDFVLVGHSLGGHIAINVAAYAKKMKGLAIFGTPPLESIGSLGQAFLPNPLMPLLFQGAITNEQAQQLADSMLCQKEYRGLLKSDILHTDPSARSSFGAFVAKGIITDEVKIVRSLNYPVAILHGESDSFINKEYIENIGFNNLWENKIHSISKSGHCPQLEQNSAFNKLLTDYYKAVFN